MKTEVVENFPEYMVYYAVYGEPGYDVTDEDIKLYEEWRDRNGYGWCYGTADDEYHDDFCSHPAFGLPCNVVPVIFEVEEGIQSSRQIKSSRESVPVDDITDIIEYYCGLYEETGELNKVQIDDLKDAVKRLRVLSPSNSAQFILWATQVLNECGVDTEQIYNSRKQSSRKISSSQKGFENVAEGTKYDDYHIDTNGMGILSVENIIEEIEGRGNQAVLTVQTSDGSTNHSQFGSKDWKEYKDSVNDAGNAITDVWVTEVEGSSYVRNSRRPIKSGYDILNVGNKTPDSNLVFYMVNDGKRMPIMTEDYAIREGGYDKDYLYEGSKNGEFVRFDSFNSIINRLAEGCGLGKEEIEQIEYYITGNKVTFTVYPTERGIHLLNNGWWDDYSIRWELSAEEQIPLYGADEKVAEC